MQVIRKISFAPCLATLSGRGGTIMKAGIKLKQKHRMDDERDIRPIEERTRSGIVTSPGGRTITVIYA